MRAWSDEERRSISGEPYRRLPDSGRPVSGMVLEPNRDYPADTDLCFERGQYADRIRLTAGDLNALRALLTDVQGGLKELRERAQELARANVPAMDLAARTAHVAAVTDLVAVAHAAGYRLCAEDHAPGDREAVRDFLLEQAELRAAGGSVSALGQQDALARVIAMLEEE